MHLHFKQLYLLYTFSGAAAYSIGNQHIAPSKSNFNQAEDMDDTWGEVLWTEHGNLILNTFKSFHNR